MIELWKLMLGFEETHEVSSTGCVRSFARKGAGGHVHLRRRPLYFTCKPGTSGYVRVEISNKNYLVHRLVAGAFLGEAPAGKPVVAHLDGDPSNNIVENLVWADQKENQSHTKIHGTYLHGETHSQSKLTWEEVRFIRYRHSLGGMTYEDFAKDFNTAPNNISSIIKHKTWKEERL